MSSERFVKEESERTILRPRKDTSVLRSWNETTRESARGLPALYRRYVPTEEIYIPQGVSS
jgi:hypothetical protein